MSHTIKRAIIAVVIAAAVYFLSGPIIGYTNYDMYLRAIEFLLSLADAIGLGATNESDAKTSMTNKEYFIYEKESDYHRSSYHLHLVGGCSSLICKSCGR